MSAMDEKRTHRKPDASEQLAAWNVGDPFQPFGCVHGGLETDVQDL